MWKKVIVLLLSILHLAKSAKQVDCGNTNLTATSSPVVEWKVPKGTMESSAVCQYIINGEPNRPVKLTFTSFVIPGAKTACSKASVKIDGFVDNVKTEVAAICNGDKTNTYYSTGSKMTVTISATEAVTPESFIANYESVENVCGEQILLAESGQATEWTTAIPLEGRICVYVIKAKPQEVVELTFKTIAGSNGQKQTSCVDPIITLESFAEGKQTKINDICSGPQETMVYKSMEQEMVVIVYGKSNTKEAAFTAEYKSIPDPDCGPALIQASNKPSEEWKIPLENLKSNKVCKYLIQGEPTHIVQLNITSFKFLGQKTVSSCSLPYLRLENVAENENPKIEDVCAGPFPKTITSSSSEMIVSLYGKDQMQASTITMKYQSVRNPACGVVTEEASEDEHSFDVYTGKDSIPKNHQCTWEITAPKDEEVEIYLKEEKDSSDKQCVEVLKPNENTPVDLCLKSDAVKTSSAQPVTIKYLGPQDGETYGNFKIYYKISSAIQIQLGMATFMFTILWIISNY